MQSYELRRWGLLLGVLSEMSDLERQLATQDQDPGTFLPDDLLERWDVTFRGGRGLIRVGVSDLMIAILLDFDSQVEELTDHLPHDADDKLAYIQHDEAWRAVCEMADWTLSRIAQMTIPEQPLQSMN